MTVCGSPRIVTVRRRSSRASASSVSKRMRQPSAQRAMIAARESDGACSNSPSRFRSGFSPSLVRKPENRERRFPAMCFMISAMLFSSSPDGAAHADVATHPAGEVAADRQPEPRAGDAPGERGVHLYERLEHRVELLPRDADAAVRDAEEHEPGML